LIVVDRRLAEQSSEVERWPLGYDGMAVWFGALETIRIGNGLNTRREGMKKWTQSEDELLSHRGCRLKFQSGEVEYFLASLPASIKLLREIPVFA
jgi:hypothetical protein